MTKYKVTYTYQIITNESAKRGESAENGYARYNGCGLETDCSAPECHNNDYTPDFDIFDTKAEAINHISGKCFCGYESSSCTGNDYYQIDPRIDYSTGDETYFCCHLDKVK